MDNYRRTPGWVFSSSGSILCRTLSALLAWLVYLTRKVEGTSGHTSAVESLSADAPSGSAASSLPKVVASERRCMP